MLHSRLRLNTSLPAYGRLFGYCVLGIDAGGNPTAKLEQELRARSGAAHALVANQGRVGIYAAIRAATRGDRKQVILSPYTLYEVVNMVIYAGGEPVFVDTTPNTPFVSADAVAALVTDRTAAILLTHYHLPCPDTPAIAELARARGVYLIEDNAVSFAGEIDGKWVGRWGDAGVFSFGLFKVLNAFYGGGVISDNAEFFTAIQRELSQFTLERRGRLLQRAIYGLALDTMMYPPLFSTVLFPLIRFGHRSDNDRVTRFTRADASPRIRDSYPQELQRTPTEVQSRLVLGQLPREDRALEIRRRRARMVADALADVEQVVLPDFPDNAVGSWTEFPIVVPDRKALYEYMLDRGRDIRYYYYRNCADLPIFESFQGDCPNARQLMHSTLMLPLYPRYPDRQIEANLEVIRDFYQRAS